jgi:hypothetical protein
VREHELTLALVHSIPDAMFDFSDDR